MILEAIPKLLEDLPTCLDNFPLRQLIIVKMATGQKIDYSENRQTLACKILNVQLQNSIPGLVFNSFGLKSKLGYVLCRIETYLKIKHNIFVLLLIKCRYFFATPGSQCLNGNCLLTAGKGLVCSGTLNTVSDENYT